MLDCELKTILSVLPEEGKRMLAAAGSMNWNENQVLSCPKCGSGMTQQETGHWD